MKGAEHMKEAILFVFFGPYVPLLRSIFTFFFIEKSRVFYVWAIAYLS